MCQHVLAILFKKAMQYFLCYSIKLSLQPFNVQNLRRLSGQQSNKIALLLPEEYLYRHTRKVKVFAKFIFYETLIGLFDVLGQVAEKGKHR